jgi:hypothetical protein
VETFGAALLLEMIVRRLDEAPAPPKIAKPERRPESSVPPEMPSPDQVYFNESLRAATRGMGRLIRDRRKRK